MSYNDTVTDAITVEICRDNEEESERINSLGFMMFGAGSVTGAILATYVERTKVLGPYSCFIIYIGLQIMFLIPVYIMQDEPVEEEEDDDERGVLVKFIDNIKAIWAACNNKPVGNTLIFFILRGLIVPSLDMIQYYFVMSEKVGMT